MNPPISPHSWWRRNRIWLAGAILLGAAAFALPYREALREYRQRHPDQPIEVARGAWGHYAGARWRVVAVERLDPASLGPAFARWPNPAALSVRFEVIPDSGTRGETLDRCRGRLADTEGRRWDANPSVLRHSGGCGTARDPDLGQIAAVAGQAFGFEQRFQVPGSLPLEGLSAEIEMPRSDNVVDGTYLRIAL